MEITGRIKVKGETNNISSTFKKREIVITTEEQYPQHISIQFNQDKVDILNNYNVGDSVKVSINLKGREWVSPQEEIKYFNSIEGWKIEKLESAPVQTKKEEPKRQPQEEEDDLPF